MPQFDISTFSSQLFWLVLVFGALYIIVSNVIAPKAEDILTNRNRYLEENISASENDTNTAIALRKQKEERLKELNTHIEKLHEDAISALEACFASKDRELEASISNRTQDSFLEIQNYLDAFRKKKAKSCIELAAFIIAKLTEKPADLKLLEKIYGTK